MNSGSAAYEIAGTAVKSTVFGQVDQTVETVFQLCDEVFDLGRLLLGAAPPTPSPVGQIKPALSPSEGVLGELSDKAANACLRLAAAFDEIQRIRRALP